MNNNSVDFGDVVVLMLAVIVIIVVNCLINMPTDYVNPYEKCVESMEYASDIWNDIYGDIRLEDFVEENWDEGYYPDDVTYYEDSECVAYTVRNSESGYIRVWTPIKDLM